MTLHPSQTYTRPQSFDRLLCLIATLAQNPGVGHLTGHSRLQELLIYLRSVATRQQIVLPPCSPHTLHKDLQTLRHYGILSDQMYRWGYYLGPSAMTEVEFNTALSALHSQATYQRDPQAQEVFNSITQRRWGKGQSSNNFVSQGQAHFYPVRAQINRSITPTDPTQVSRKGSATRTLYSALDTLETAILKGEALQIRRISDPYQQGQGDPGSGSQKGSKSIWPLQLIHYDIAWYLAYEQCDTQHLVMGRLDRFDDDCQVLSHPRRSRSQQLQRLQQVHELLENGWGLFLGEPEEQRQELRGRLPLTEITVRFYGSTIAFIQEGGYRHPSQKILTSSGHRQHLDYQVKLPPRSHGEFLRWVNRFMGNVQILTPAGLAEQHAHWAEQQLQRYRSGKQKVS